MPIEAQDRSSDWGVEESIGSSLLSEARQTLAVAMKKIIRFQWAPATADPMRP
jgi:hypothetical protein